MSRVYLDASAIIYLVEAESSFHAAALQRVARFRGDPKSRLVRSRLSRLECRVKPLRDSNEALLAKYDAFFRRRRLIIGDVAASVIERATELRARYRFKTPDASARYQIRSLRSWQATLPDGLESRGALHGERAIVIEGKRQGRDFVRSARLAAHDVEHLLHAVTDADE